MITQKEICFDILVQIEKNDYVNENTQSEDILIKGQDGKVVKAQIGKCPYRSITTKASGVTALRCMAARAVGEASLFETCQDIALNNDECSKSV